MEERRATVGGLRMRWLEHGAGPAVVLLHGIPTSPELWRRVLPALHGVRSLAWEMPGYGESMEEAGPDLSLQGQAGHLLRWMDHLGIERTVLAGHDLGGGLAQIVAVRWPDRVAGLVLADAVGYDAWPVPAVKLLRTLGPVVRRLPPRLLAAGLRVFMHRAHDDRAVAAASADVHLARYARPGGPPALVRQVQALDARDTVAVQDALPGLRVPAMVVWGEDDPYLPIRLGRRFSADLVAPLVRIQGGRHFTPEDHPASVAAAIQTVLGASRRGREGG